MPSPKTHHLDDMKQTGPNLDPPLHENTTPPLPDSQTTSAQPTNAIHQSVSSSVPISLKSASSTSLSVLDTQSSTTLRQSRAGRRPKFTSGDDIIIVREVAAAKAHVAPNGETKERFEIAASRANATGKLSCAVTWKSIQDRYKRLQSCFDRQDAAEAAMSGIGEEVGEMEELLSSMKEARDDKDRAASEKKEALKKKEKDKERLGAVIRMQALKRRAERTAAGEESQEHRSLSDDVDDDTPRKRSRNIAASLHDGFDSELKQFTEAISRGDEERNRLEEQRMQLDRERFEIEIGERAKDREERRGERKASNELELQKFRAMLEVFGTKKGGNS